MSWTDDPIADFHRHDAEQEAKLAKLPICCCCKNPIQQEKAVCNDDKYYCEECEDEAWAIIRKGFLVRITD